MQNRTNTSTGPTSPSGGPTSPWYRELPCGHSGDLHTTLDDKLMCWFRRFPLGVTRKYAVQTWNEHHVSRTSLDRWVGQQVTAGTMHRQKLGREVRLWVVPTSG